MPAAEGGDVLRIEVQAHSNALGALRTDLTRWLEHRSWDRQRSFDMVLAVSEAAANVIAHAYSRKAGVLAVEALDEEDAVEVVVSDAGCWRSASPGEGGRGLPMMHALVDSVHVRRTAQGTEVRLRQERSVGV